MEICLDDKIITVDEKNLIGHNDPIGPKGEDGMNPRKFYGQQCQDEKITMEFRELHKEIVDRIIKFCNDHNITIDEVTMKIYDIDESIPYNSWQAPTDSALTFMKFSDDWKAVMRCEKTVTKKEFEKIKFDQEPYLFSM